LRKSEQDGKGLVRKGVEKKRSGEKSGVKVIRGGEKRSKVKS
jgi:hypothetical protein